MPFENDSPSVKANFGSWQLAQEKSIGPPRKKNARLPSSYMRRSSACACGSAKRIPRDSAAIQRRSIRFSQSIS